MFNKGCLPSVFSTAMETKNDLFKGSMTENTNRTGCHCLGVSLTQSTVKVCNISFLNIYPVFLFILSVLFATSDYLFFSINVTFLLQLEQNIQVKYVNWL